MWKSITGGQIIRRLISDCGKIQINSHGEDIWKWGCEQWKIRLHLEQEEKTNSTSAKFLLDVQVSPKIKCVCTPSTQPHRKSSVRWVSLHNHTGKSNNHLSHPTSIRRHCPSKIYPNFLNCGERGSGVMAQSEARLSQLLQVGKARWVHCRRWWRVPSMFSFSQDGLCISWGCTQEFPIVGNTQQVSNESFPQPSTP